MLKLLLLIICRTAALCLGSWLVMVSLYSPAFGATPGLLAAVSVVILYIAALVRPRIMIFPACLISIVIISAWIGLKPSDSRDWQPELSKLPSAQINGDLVRIDNVRDFNYRSETDFDERWVTKNVRLSELSSLDLFASYWSSRHIAHIFLTFGFADSEYISFSIEARKARDQAYSAINGFFRNYELIYVVAEERDLVQLRTKYRQPNEQVYLFQLRYYKDNAVKLFLKYLENMNNLRSNPQFYNSLTTNCTTQVLNNAQLAGGTRKLSYDWRLLLSGHMPEYLHKYGNLDSSMPLGELMKISLINSKSQGEQGAAEFSKAIRAGLPRPLPFIEAPR